MHRAAPLLALVAGAAGHGAVTFPRPRNAVDGAIAPWSDWGYPCDAAHRGASCAISLCYNARGCAGSCPISAHRGKGVLDARNGQACYWFSNGCTIGCDKCDGSQSHVGHGGQKFLYKGMDSATLRRKNIIIPDPWFPSPGDMALDPQTATSLAIKSNCAAPTTNATICDSRLRSANSQAECGSPQDYYYFSPWRAPGSAPVIDACGSAGGRFPGQGIGGGAAGFQNSSVAKQGDVGSQLPPTPSQATWEAGSNAEVGWTVMANHGGGYAYRLAPADAPLTEETFRKMPLDFVGPSILRWDGDRSTQLAFDPAAKGWETSKGTVPEGSMWRKNPIPSGLWEREGPQFTPVCEESEACKAYVMGHGGPQGVCRCSGYSNGGPLLPNLEVVDSLRIPAGLAPGSYVLQWRWDCEESDQVWASCSDVTVTPSTCGSIHDRTSCGPIDEEGPCLDAGCCWDGAARDSGSAPACYRRPTPAPTPPPPTPPPTPPTCADANGTWADSSGAYADISITQVDCALSVSGANGWGCPGGVCEGSISGDSIIVDFMVTHPGRLMGTGRGGPIGGTLKGDAISWDNGAEWDKL